MLNECARTASRQRSECEETVGLFLSEGAGAVGVEELLEILNLLQQFFSFVGIFDPYPFAGEILQERPTVNIRP